MKTKGGKAWTADLQSELDGLYVLTSLVEEAKNAYKPAPGTEDMVHLSLCRTRRFNPSTGVEETKPYTQVFTHSEWQLFKKNARLLGYHVVEVLHDPYGDAQELVGQK